MARLNAPYQPVYRGLDPKTWKADHDRELAKTWAQRTAADRRLSALLTQEQRRTLDALKRDSTAWTPTVGKSVVPNQAGSPPSIPPKIVPVQPHRAQTVASPAVTRPAAKRRTPSVETNVLTQANGVVNLQGDAKIEGIALDTLPMPYHAGEPVQIVGLGNGSVWRIYRVDKEPPFSYRVERERNHRLDYATRKVFAPPGKGAVQTGHRISVFRWEVSAVAGPALEEGAWKTMRNSDGSTWTLIRERGRITPDYRLEYRLEAPSGEFHGHVFPTSPPPTLTVDGASWTIHPASTKRG